MNKIKIRIEFDMALEEQTLEGNFVSTVELNKLGRSGKSLLYKMNIMDENNKVYMWFVDGENENYFVELNY